MRGNEICIDCPSSLICNFGVGTERGHIYVCSDCGAADFVISADDLRNVFLRKTGHAMGVKLKEKERTFRLPSSCPMLQEKGVITEYVTIDDTRVFRPVMYVCADCFNRTHSKAEHATYACIYGWLHGRAKNGGSL